jgi:hypothetical protein
MAVSEVTELTRGRLGAFLYPAALPAAYVYSAWADSSIHHVHLLVPLLAVVVVSAALAAGLAALAGSQHLGSLAAAVLGLAAITSNAAAGVALCGLAALMVVIGRVGDVQVGPTITRVATTIAALFAILAVATSADRVWPRIQADFDPALRELPAAAAGPDIYVILLDGYPGSRAAASYDPSWDWSAFPESLEARGFEVLADSRSNYTRTDLAMASLFGMRHVTPLDPTPGASSLRSLLDRGPARQAIRAAGYEMTAISSGFAFVDVHSADRYIDPSEVGEFELALLRSTNAGRLLTLLVPDFAAEQQRRRIQSTFVALEGLAAEDGGRPRLTFAHVPAPHGPFVYRADGAALNEGLPAFYNYSPTVRGITRAETITRSLDQATFTADRTLRALDRILGADPSAVIAVFSDHGPGVDFHQEDPFGGGLEERVSNLMALRAPGDGPRLVAGTTPVNLLPLLFNAYLGTEIPFVADDTFAWPAGATEATRVE